VLGGLLCGNPPPACAAEPISPIPQTAAYDRDKADLGKKLFFDPLLSEDRSMSCSLCHDIYGGGGDHKRVAIGIKGRKGLMNSELITPRDTISASLCLK